MYDFCMRFSIVASLLLPSMAMAKVGEATFEVVREAIGDSDVASPSVIELLELFASSTYDIPTQTKIVRTIKTLQNETPPHKSVSIWLLGLKHLSPASAEIRSSLIDIAELSLQNSSTKKKIAALDLLESMAEMSSIALRLNLKPNLEVIHQDRVLGALNDAVTRTENETDIEFQVRAAKLLFKLAPLNEYVGKRRAQILIRFALKHSKSVLWQDILKGLAEVVTAPQSSSVQREMLRMLNAISTHIHSNSDFGSQMIVLLGMLRPNSPELVSEKFKLLAKFIASPNLTVSEAALAVMRENLADLEQRLYDSQYLASSQRTAIEIVTGTNWPDFAPFHTPVTRDSAAPQIIQFLGLIYAHDPITFTLRAKKLAQTLRSSDGQMRSAAATEILKIVETLRSGSMSEEMRAQYLNDLGKEIVDSLKTAKRIDSGGFEDLNKLIQLVLTSESMDYSLRAQIMARVIALGGAQQKQLAIQFTLSQIQSGVLDCEMVLKHTLNPSNAENRPIK